MAVRWLGCAAGAVVQGRTRAAQMAEAGGAGWLVPTGLAMAGCARTSREEFVTEHTAEAHQHNAI